MASGKYDFTKMALESMQGFDTLAKKSKYAWSHERYEAVFEKIGRALENGRLAMEEISRGIRPGKERKENQSGVALREAVKELKTHKLMYVKFLEQITKDAGNALEKFPEDGKAIEEERHELQNCAARIFSCMTSARDEMEEFIPKRKESMKVQR